MRYQSDKPLVPFLDADLSTLLRGLCRRFVKKIVMDSASSSALLVKVNVSDSASHIGNVKIDTGFSATKALNELAATKKCSDLARMRFRDDCKNALVAATDKLLVKSPLKYVMTRNLACLDPRMMASDSHGCVSSFRRVLHKLADLHQVNEADCDLIGWQFAAFMDEVVTPNNSAFKEFSPDNDRLDTFLSIRMKGSDHFGKLWPVTKKLLILSHGQATVERGFSINSQLVVENLREASVVSQRVVYDAIATAGGLCGVPITKSILSYAQGARQRYVAYLEAEKQKQTSINSDCNAKRKLEADERDKLEAKKRRLDNDIAALMKSSDELADSAEAMGDLTLLSQSNALRKSAATKRQALKDL